MMRIGKMVEMRAHAGEQGFLSYTCSPDDVAILISYSGETNEMVELAKFFKKDACSPFGYYFYRG